MRWGNSVLLSRFRDDDVGHGMCSNALENQLLAFLTSEFSFLISTGNLEVFYHSCHGFGFDLWGLLQTLPVPLTFKTRIGALCTSHHH